MVSYRHAAPQMVDGRPPAAADDILLSNGDRLTGTVVSLGGNTLTVDTAYGDGMSHAEIAIHDAGTAALVEAYGALPGPQACDGIVPTRSQVYGRVLTAVRADHLDAIGHFDAPKASPPHYDWLVSGSGFGVERFVRLWRKVADFQLADEPPPPGDLAGG